MYEIIDAICKTESILDYGVYLYLCFADGLLSFVSDTNGLHCICRCAKSVDFTGVWNDSLFSNEENILTVNKNQ